MFMEDLSFAFFPFTICNRGIIHVSNCSLKGPLNFFVVIFCRLKGLGKSQKKITIFVKYWKSQKKHHVYCMFTLLKLHWNDFISEVFSLLKLNHRHSPVSCTLYTTLCVVLTCMSFLHCKKTSLRSIMKIFMVSFEASSSI